MGEKNKLLDLQSIGTRDLASGLSIGFPSQPVYSDIFSEQMNKMTAITTHTGSLQLRMSKERASASAPPTQIFHSILTDNFNWQSCCEYPFKYTSTLTSISICNAKIFAERNTYGPIFRGSPSHHRPFMCKVFYQYCFYTQNIQCVTCMLEKDAFDVLTLKSFVSIRDVSVVT